MATHRRYQTSEFELATYGAVDQIDCAKVNNKSPQQRAFVEMPSTDTLGSVTWVRGAYFSDMIQVANVLASASLRLG